MPKFYKIPDNTKTHELWDRLTNAKIVLEDVRGYVQNTGILKGTEVTDYFNKLNGLVNTLNDVIVRSTQYFKDNQVSEEQAIEYMNQLSNQYNNDNPRPKKQVNDIDDWKIDPDDDLPF